MRFVVLALVAALCAAAVSEVHELESVPGLEQYVAANERAADFAQKKLVKKSSGKHIKHKPWTHNSTCPGTSEGFCVVKYGNRQFEMVHCQTLEKNMCDTSGAGHRVPCTKEAGQRRIICVEEDIAHGAARKKLRKAWMKQQSSHHKCVTDSKLKAADPTRGGACKTASGHVHACKHFDEYFTKCHQKDGKTESCDCVTLAYKQGHHWKCLPAEKLSQADASRGGQCGYGHKHQFQVHCESFADEMQTCVHKSGHHSACPCVTKAYRPHGPPRKCISHHRVRVLASAERGGECRVKGRDHKCDSFSSDFRWCITHTHRDQECQCVTKAYRPHRSKPGKDENYVAWLKERKRTRSWRKKHPKKSSSRRRRG